jgi:hypothetical protein
LRDLCDAVSRSFVPDISEELRTTILEAVLVCRCHKQKLSFLLSLHRETKASNGLGSGGWHPVGSLYTDLHSKMEFALDFARNLKSNELYAHLLVCASRAIRFYPKDKPGGSIAEELAKDAVESAIDLKNGALNNLMHVQAQVGNASGLHATFRSLRETSMRTDKHRDEAVYKSLKRKYGRIGDDDDNDSALPTPAPAPASRTPVPALRTLLVDLPVPSSQCLGLFARFFGLNYHRSNSSDDVCGVGTDEDEDEDEDEEENND